MRLPPTKTKIDYVKFQGGLDLESPTLGLDPGSLIAGMNYQTGPKGGYERIDGYEIFSGKAAPSDGTYHYCEVNLVATVSIGDTVTGITSGATGVVVINDTTSLCITKVVGTFVTGENFTVGGNVKGSLSVLPVLKGEPTGLGNALALAAVAGNYRTDITAPTGSGPIRGLGILKGVVYCFINNAGGTAGLIYKATVSGWSVVSLYHELSFDTGVGEIFDGDVIVQLTSGATATVQRVVRESGTWGSTAAGRLILSNITGTFNATNDLQVSSVTKATSTSLATQITISPNGRYEIIPYNFTGSTDTLRLYGCDGVNRGFEFDGTVYVPINTGMTTDTPLHCIAHKKHLFFSFKASSQNSGIGSPYVWSPVSGASEICLGDNITGYSIQPGDVLVISSRESTAQLTGSSVADFVLGNIAYDIGTIPYTNQNIGRTYCLDDRGVCAIYSTDKYGNYTMYPISSKVRKVIQTIRSKAVASSIYKESNQYRLYADDGSGLCMTIQDTSKGTLYSFTQFQYPVNVSCVVSGEDSSGKDVIFFGATNGKVYQANKGSSFDGEEIEAYLRFAFNHSKSPSTLKTYRKATVEMTAESYTSVRFHPEVSYGDPAITQHGTTNLEIQGSGGYWDMNNWEDFYYDTFIVSIPSFSINTDGINISLIVYSKNAIDLGHKLDGYIIHYTPRRLIR